MGEFGVVRPSADFPAVAADRLEWLSSVRTAAEGRGFAWALWAYRGPGGMALLDEKSKMLDAETLRAIGLRAA